jgi:uncharacterized membrane protein
MSNATISTTPSTLVAAMAALLAATVSACGAADVDATAPEGEEQPIRCEGINECQGTSECASSDGSSECKGLNECAGQGWIYAESETACTDAGGTVL